MNGVTAHKYDETQNNNIMVVIPFKNNDGPKVIENVTIEFNEDLELLGYSEIEVNENEETLESIVYMDGEQITQVVFCLLKVLDI